MSYFIPPPTPRPSTKKRNDEEERLPLLMPSAEVLANTPVYPLIHLIRVDVTSHIDTPLTIDQLLAPDSTYTIVRPLTEKYASMDNHAIIFCLLLNRVQFLKDSNQLSINTLSVSRAMLCEVLATRVLRGWSERTLPLSTLLLTPWALFQGASPAIISRAKEEGDDDEDLAESAGNALEMAILGNAKRFIRSPSAQKVITGIWGGKIVYHAINQHAMISDNYKKKPIQIYNPHKAPLLDHYRLKVPRIRSIIEYSNFIILFVLYVSAIEGLEQTRINWREVLFIVYAMGFSLDKLAAMREHGLKVFAANLWNGFDLAFIVIYASYLSLRLYGLNQSEVWAKESSIDILAIGAVGMFPRLAFVSLSNNLMILSLRSMMSEFFTLIGIAIFCFLGFMYALWTLGGGTYSWTQIGWYLLETYFGLDATGFRTSTAFHQVLGPMLMVSFAFLANTLLLTVLVAILSNTFAIINADASAESMFRRAVSTLSGLKADAVFSYQLPFNVIAVVIMFPLSFVLSPRWFHKVNVFMIRATSFPLLLAIAIYERSKYHPLTLSERFERWCDQRIGQWPKRVWNGVIDTTGIESFSGAGRNIDFIFEIEREIGDFYKGWDEDAMDDDDEENEANVIDSDSSSSDDDSTVRPPKSAEGDIPFPSAPQSIGDTQYPKRQGVGNGFPRSSTIPISMHMTPNTEGERPKLRRGSLPAAEQPGSSAFSLLSTSPRKRRGSIVEPSPLARLFVRSPPKESLMHRAHRPSNSASMMAQSLGGVVSQVKDHHRNRSLGSALMQPMNPLSMLEPIPAGKRVSFSADKVAENAAKADDVDVKEASDVLTATALAEKRAQGSPVVLATEVNGMQKKLEQIEKHNRKIERLLERLLASSSHEAAEGRRDSGVSMDH